MVQGCFYLQIQIFSVHCRTMLPFFREERRATYPVGGLFLPRHSFSCFIRSNFPGATDRRGLMPEHSVLCWSLWLHGFAICFLGKGGRQRCCDCWRLGMDSACRQSSVWAWKAELRGLWDVRVPSLPLSQLPLHQWIDCGAQGPPQIAEKEDARRGGYTTQSQRRKTGV